MQLRNRLLVAVVVLAASGVLVPAAPRAQAPMVAPATQADAGGAQADVGTAPAAAEAAPARRDATAPLVIFNRTVFVFRSTFLGVEPMERAAIARERILEVLDRPGAVTTSVEPAPQGAIVRVGNVFAFVVAPGDVDAVAGESPMDVGRQAAKALDRVIAETREARDVHALLVAAGLALVATAIGVFLLWILVRARRALGHRMQEATARRVDSMRLGGVEVVPGDHVRQWARRGVNVVFWLLALLVVYEWLGYVLTRFPFTRPWGERLNAFLIGAGQRILEGIAHAIPGLAIALVIFLIARAVARASDAFLRRVQSGQVEVGWLDADTARPTRRLVTIVIWAFALVMAYPYLPGSNTDAFKGMSVLIGLMVSLGASSVIAQGAAGLILMYTRTLRPGEYVQVGEHQGTVVELTMFATRIRTGMGVELTLPSALVLGAVTLNYSRAVRGDGFLVDIDVTIGYDVPWRQVHAMLLEAARQTPGVLNDPPPHVYQTALSDFYVGYHLVCQAIPAETRPRAEVISHLHANVQDVFNEHGVQIMSPNYEADPETPKIVPKDRWFAAPARASGRG